MYYSSDLEKNSASQQLRPPRPGHHNECKFTGKKTFMIEFVPRMLEYSPDQIGLMSISQKIQFQEKHSRSLGVINDSSSEGWHP